MKNRPRNSKDCPVRTLNCYAIAILTPGQGFHISWLEASSSSLASLDGGREKITKVENVYF